MPRAIASSARAAWVQCVMGRPASLGFSQASAMIAQICSGVNVAGVRRLQRHHGQAVSLDLSGQTSCRLSDENGLGISTVQH
jgi:hypothetical protein